MNEVYFYWPAAIPIPERSLHGPYPAGTAIDSRESWILQTYWRLLDSGYPVSLADNVPSAGVVVIHRDDLHSLPFWPTALGSVTWVSVRSDRASTPLGDIEIVQNSTVAKPCRIEYMNHWPQPGLVARDRKRGNTVENVAYKGVLENLHPAMRTEEWTTSLARQGIHFELDIPNGDDSASCNWHDYRDVDVVVALRPRSDSQYIHKPPSKLINAWLAGVPAVLGGEGAYRGLRKSALDYIEVGNSEDALAAILRLRDSPTLYKTMVEAGFKRSIEVSSEATLRAWIDFLGKARKEARAGTVGRLLRSAARLGRAGRAASKRGAQALRISVEQQRQPTGRR